MTTINHPTPLGPRNPAGARYYDTASQRGWSGLGLMPAWIKAKLEAGHPLAEFESRPVLATAAAEAAAA